MLRSFAIVALCVCATVAACRATAAAETEFCPAKITEITAKPFGSAANTYYYRLQGEADRSLAGTIVADTDAGWFTWTQQPAQLTRMTYTSSSPAVTYSFQASESPEMMVDFPKPVIVRRAWVEAAQTHGDRFFGWDSQGMVMCDPPDFGPPKYRSNETTRRTPHPGDETPAPAPPPVNATPTTAPFSLTCAQPFVSATVTKAAQPNFPTILHDQGFRDYAISMIAVAVGPQGNLVDAWVFAKTLYPALDEEALKAARKSTYRGAVSYCRPVSGVYLFRADFEP